MRFRTLFNFLTKGTLLEEAFDLSEQIHDKTCTMFSLATRALIEHNMKLMEEVIKSDTEVNMDFIRIRKKLFEYLSVAAAPNISACLILSNVAIDYERIGDYCKNIAQLIEWYPVRFTEERYLDGIIAIRDRIDRMFKNTKEAIINENKEMAKAVIVDHSKNKETHLGIVKALNNDKDITVKEAIVIAKVTGYLRRVSAHLGNICTGVIRPFPKMGFLKKFSVDMDSNDYLLSRTKLD